MIDRARDQVENPSKDWESDQWGLIFDIHSFQSRKED